MIKLIISDLDGTLLLPDGSLPQEIFSLIDALHRRNVLFAVASGRQQESLRKLFAPVADKIIFIAENGALVFYEGKQIFGEHVPYEQLDGILKILRQDKNVCPLLCCKNYAYAEVTHPSFLSCCEENYPHFKRIENLNDIPEKNSICKIAIYDERGALENVGKYLPPQLPNHRVIVSGNVWLDISMPSTNKGKALAFIQQYLNIKQEECAGFGDYMNDLEFLSVCKHAYVPANGFPLLKERFPNVIPSNAEKGVIQKIKEILEATV